MPPGTVYLLPFARHNSTLLWSHTRRDAGDSRNTPDAFSRHDGMSKHESDAPQAGEFLASRCSSPVHLDSKASSEERSEASISASMSNAPARTASGAAHQDDYRPGGQRGQLVVPIHDDVVMSEEPLQYSASRPDIYKPSQEQPSDLLHCGDAPRAGRQSPAHELVHGIGRVRAAEEQDYSQAHSPRSSTNSQRKREASSSPSRSEKGERLGVVARKYGAEGKGAAAVPRRKRHMRSITSGLRATPLVSTSNHYRTQSAGVALASNLPPTDEREHPNLVTSASHVRKANPYRQDSGYASRQNTGPQPSWNPEVRAPAYANFSSNHIDEYGYGVATKQAVFTAPQPRYNMLLQPKCSPLTQEQLGAEVKGIYAGLVMVEAKCITMDNARAADPTAEVSKEDWQTLIALHRTLLYEHHDFLMATQHPSANPALRGLASKYCMPARMWKHGIHSFLEVLRHRRPHSQEYMLAFICLSYQMMCLLFDTIPSYLDTWIECLGDLARYRMAIEEDKEIHAVWCAVAGRWYQMAADRHPQIGRLYHHLGILERPSLRKFYFYARSLTSVVPFLNSAESLGNLCAPILQDDTAMRCGNHSAEAMTICFHARVFTSQSKGNASEALEAINRDGIDAHDLIKEQPSAKIATYGVALAVTNITAIFQYGLQENVFRIMYSEVLAREAHNARPSVQEQEGVSEAAKAVDASGAQQTTSPPEAVIKFWADCFNSLIHSELNQATLRDLMQYVHVNLVFISSLINLRTRLRNQDHINAVSNLFSRLHWAKLATFCNAISQIDPITQRVEVHAVQNIFLMPDRPADRRPLVEDYMLRGIVWSENYPSAELFFGIEDDDGSRTIDTPARLHLRAERVLWLACLIAQPLKKSGLQYDRATQRFGARPLITQAKTLSEHRLRNTSTNESQLLEESTAPSIKHGAKTDDVSSMSPKSLEVLQPSPPSSTGDGFDMVSSADVRSLSSHEDSRISTPLKSFRSAKSTSAIRGSPEGNHFPTPRHAEATTVSIGSERENLSIRR